MPSTCFASRKRSPTNSGDTGEGGTELPGELADAVLDHVGLYRVTIRPALSRAVFQGGYPGNVLKELLAAGLLAVHHDPRLGGYTLYTLTPAGARGRVPRKRAAELTTRRLPRHLATLWHCTMTDTPRMRLEPEQVARLLGRDLPVGPQGLYCLAGQERVEKLYVPGPETPPAAVLRAVARDMHAARRGDAAVLMDARLFTFVILVDVAARAAAIRAAIRAPRFPRFAQVQVAFAPTPATLPAALRDGGGGFHG